MPLLHSLNTLSDDDLYLLLECDDLSKLMEHERFLHLTEGMKKEIHEDLQRIANAMLGKQIKYAKITHAALPAITESSSYPLTILSSFLNACLALLRVALITIGSALLFAVMAGSYFYTKYIEKEKADKKNQKVLQLAALKLQASEILNSRHAQSYCPQPKPAQQIVSELLNKDYTIKKPKVILAKSTLVTTAVSGTLFAIYHFGVGSVVGALGLTTAAAVMAWPISLTIALGVAFAVGLYFGHCYYEGLKQDKIIKKQIKELNKEVRKQTNMCHTLKQHVDNKRENPLKEIKEDIEKPTSRKKMSLEPMDTTGNLANHSIYKRRHISNATNTTHHHAIKFQHKRR